MNFGEKLRQLRDGRGMTQVETARKLQVSLRAYQNYESGKIYPKNSVIYQRIAALFGVLVDSLMDEKDLFLAEAQEKYGSRGREQARRIVEATEALYAGGALTEEDEEAFYQHMSSIFIKAKVRNAERYAERMRPKETDG